MTRSKGITIFGIAIIVTGGYNLIGIGSYKQFALMLKGLDHFWVLALYVFTILYGICGVYCGTRILKLEDWARKVMVGLTTVSVISGFMLNKMVMANFRDFVSSSPDFPPEMVGSAYTYAVIFTALVTLFELSVIFFFTRSGVVCQFKTRHSTDDSG